METYDDNGDAGGGTRTDYSFRFAKRFYNDRIRVVLGGRISTGENINNGQAQPFIDNVSVEYRLDGAAAPATSELFHDKNYESLLEGEITGDRSRYRAPQEDDVPQGVIQLQENKDKTHK